jgi:ribosome maturation factor RimP
MEVVMDICSKIRELLASVIEEEGCILDDVLFEKNGKNSVLTIVIDKVGTVSIDDCVTITNRINPILDEADPIEESYILDVCSKEKGCE